jgi:hypothetical protein
MWPEIVQTEALLMTFCKCCKCSYQRFREHFEGKLGNCGVSFSLWKMTNTVMSNDMWNNYFLVAIIPVVLTWETFGEGNLTYIWLWLLVYRLHHRSCAGWKKTMSVFPQISHRLWEWPQDYQETITSWSLNTILILVKVRHVYGVTRRVKEGCY